MIQNFKTPKYERGRPQCSPLVNTIYPPPPIPHKLTPVTPPLKAHNINQNLLVGKNRVFNNFISPPPQKKNSSKNNKN